MNSRGCERKGIFQAEEKPKPRPGRMGHIKTDINRQRAPGRLAGDEPEDQTRMGLMVKDL